MAAGRYRRREIRTVREWLLHYNESTTVSATEQPSRPEHRGYAIANQRDRRNLTDAEILSLVKALDKRRKAGRPEKELASREANFPGKSAAETAVRIGTSSTKVESARAVLADPVEALLLAPARGLDHR